MRKYLQMPPSAKIEAMPPWLVSALYVFFLYAAALGDSKSIRQLFSGAGTYSKLFTIGIVVLAAVCLLVYEDAGKLPHVGRFALLWYSLYIWLILWSVMIWVLNFEPVSVIWAGCLKMVNQLVNVMVSLCAVYLLGRRAIRCTCYGLLLAYGSIILIALPEYGLQAALQSLIHNVMTQGGSAGFAAAIEVNDITYALGMFFVYFCCFGEKESHRVRDALLCALGMLLGFKRIELPALGLALMLGCVLNRLPRQAKQRLLMVMPAAMAAFCWCYLAFVRTGAFGALMGHLQVNMMSRDALYTAVEGYYSLSPSFRGIGYGRIYELLDAARREGLLASNYNAEALHNDILKQYIECGFVGFVIWQIYYFGVQQWWLLKRYGAKVGSVFVCCMSFLLITYCTDNTLLFYYDNLTLHIVCMACATGVSARPLCRFWSNQRSGGRIPMFNKFKGKKRKAWTGVILTGLLVLAVLLVGLSCFLPPEASRVLLTLCYEGADQGLNPNGTRLNIYELASLEVMEQAVANAGLTGVLAPEKLAEQIQVSPCDFDNGMYIPTAYQISYTRNKEIKEISAEKMLEYICQSYEDYFCQRYGPNQAALEYSLGDVSDVEYAVIGELLAQKARILSNYLEGIAGGHAYSEPDASERLNALQARLDTLECDIADYQAYVLQNGLAKDASGYINTLEYENMRLRQSYDQCMAAYQNGNEGIGMYSTALSIGGQGDSDLSQSDNEMSALTNSTQAALEDAASILLEMERNQAVISKISSAAPTTDQVGRAEELISSIDAQLSDLAAELKEAEQDWFGNPAYLSVQPVNLSVLERLNLPTMVLACLCGLGAAVLSVYTVQAKRKV